MPIQNNAVEKSFQQKARFKRRRYLETDWNNILRDADFFEDKAKRLLKEDKSEEAASISLTWLICFGQGFDEEAFMYDEEGFIMATHCKEFAQTAATAVQHSCTSMHFRQEAVEMAKQISQCNTYDDYGFLNVNDFVKNIAMSIQSPEEELESLDELIISARRNTSHDTPLPHLAIRRYEILVAKGQADIAMTKLMEDVSNIDVCNFIVNHYLEAKTPIKAIQTLEQAISQLNWMMDSFEIHELLKQKIEIYKEIGDKQSIIDTYRLLFRTNDGNLEYYHQLKQLIPKEQWPSYLDKLMNDTTFCEFFMEDDPNNKAEILIEEKKIQELATYLLELDDFVALDAYRQYINKVPTAYLPPIIERYIHLLQQYVDGGTGSSNYENTAQHIRCIMQLPGGKQPALEFVEKLRTHYTNRPALKRVLKEFI